MNNIDIKSIKLFITDVDGVLTDSGYIYDENGNISKRFNTRDFYALNFIKNKIGIPVMGLSGADDNATIKRFEELGIPLAYGIKDKLKFTENLIKAVDIKYENIAFVGDHWIDLQLLKKCGVSFCPKDAVYKVRQVCKNVSLVDGGHGVIEDFLCQIFSEIYENAHR